MGKKFYDWSIISADYNSGLGYRDLHKKYGISVGAIAKATKRGDIQSRTIVELMIIEFFNFIIKIQIRNMIFLLKLGKENFLL